MRMKRYVEAEHVLQQAGLSVNLAQADSRGRHARSSFNEQHRKVGQKADGAPAGISFFGGYPPDARGAAKTVPRRQHDSPGAVRWQTAGERRDDVGRRQIVDSINTQMHRDSSARHNASSKTALNQAVNQAVMIQDPLLEY